MKIRVKKKVINTKESTFIIGLCFIFCIIIAFTKEFIFPAKFFSDVNTIQKLIIRPIYYNADDKSYSNVATIFRFLSLDRYVTVPMICIITFFYSFYSLLKENKIKYIGISKLVLIFLYSVMAMTYMSTYSKDFILFIFVILPFIFLQNRLILWTIIVLIYAYFFRSYWVLIICLFWAIRIYFIYTNKRLLFLFISIFFVFSFLFQKILGVHLSSFREAANLLREDSENAKTLIESYLIGRSILVQGLNALITFLFLIVPVPLLLMFSPYYIFLFLIIFSLFFIFFKFLNSEVKKREYKYKNIFSLIISILVVQSIFEPDYGSFVRHLSPMYPLFFIILIKADE